MTDPARQVLHVGLAKTGTTTLQRHVFPQISQIAGYDYNPRGLAQQLTNFMLFRDPAARKDLKEQIAGHAPFLVSDETLATWLPQHFEAAADELLALFGPHTTILITLRDPVDFEASLYAGSYRAGAYVSPKQFFLSDERYHQGQPHKGPWLDDTFNVDQFDLRRLVEIYQQRFDRVVALPLPTLFDLHALARVFGISEDERRAIAKQLASAPRLNSRPASWDIKAHTFYVKMTGQQMTRPGLGQKLTAHAQASPSTRAGGRIFNGRHWWLKLRAFLYRVLPNTPYQLPTGTYQNAELTQRNREYVAELIAEERAARLSPNA